MSTRTSTTKIDPFIENKADLIGVFAKGEKPRDAWRIGTEHEKFVYRTADHRAPSYGEEGGILALSLALSKVRAANPQIWQPLHPHGWLEGQAR